MKKKVLYVITKGNFGGAQRYVFDLATHLSKTEFEAVVVTGVGATLGEKCVASGIRTIAIPSLKRNIGIFSDIRAFFSLWNIVRIEKPDVLHLNSSKAGGLGVIVGKFSGVKHIVFTGHAWAFNEERSVFSKLLLYKIYWWIIMLSHRTIAVSERTRDQVSWMPFVKNKISVIYNGIEVFPMVAQPQARLALAPSVGEKMWIGTLSELHKSKGLDLLLRAFAELTGKYANIALVIVGGGEEKQSLMALSEELNIRDRITFTGSIPDARSNILAFDIFTLTSRTEAFPYALLEAGIAELPVVSTWVGGIPEIITNNESGILVDPIDTEALTSALEELIIDAEKRKSLSLALKHHVTQTFTIENMVNKTMALY